MYIYFCISRYKWRNFMKNLKRLISVLLVVILSVCAASVMQAAEVTFTDVSGHWAWTQGQIPYLVEKNVLNGYKQTNGTYQFKPDGNVTRAEFIKMLDETFGLTATTNINFKDVTTSDWFYPYFQKAAAQGYILNYGTNATPNAAITREEAISLLVRYLDLPASAKPEASQFSDIGSVSSNFTDYILRAEYASLTNGYKQSDGSYLFKPKNTLTRAEALTILYRAAGAIFNANATSRDSGAASENNVITKGDIAIMNTTFNGRNIVSEGASSGTITFSGCKFNSTLTVRGGANVRFDNCVVKELVIEGGGSVSLVNATMIDVLTLETTSTLNIYSGTNVAELNVKYGAANTKASGDGTISKVNVNASGFNATMMPGEFEIGNNLTAIFAQEQYTGSSTTQNAFDMDPFVTSDGTDYYLNFIPSEDGEVYYYFTNSDLLPSANNYDAFFNAATYGKVFKVEDGEVVSQKTYSNEVVGKFNYVVIQLRAGTKKFAPIVVNSVTASGNGFATEPYLEDTSTVKFKTSTSGVLYWCYVSDGDALNQIEFVDVYTDTESALKGQVSVTSSKTYPCTLSESYLDSYGFVAFMLKGSNGLFHTPVTLSVGYTGFSQVPAVKTPGLINLTPELSGTLYYYYSETKDLPSAETFKSEFNAARYSDSDTITRGTATEIRYNTSYVDDYPYMIMAIRNSSRDYLQPLVISIDYTTGFSSGPDVRSASEIRFKTKFDGEVWYYYTKSDKTPSIEDFKKNYNNTTSNRYRGTVDVTEDLYRYIEYTASYASTYPYIAIMLVDENGKYYCPVVVELDIVSETGFSLAPYVLDEKIYFKTEGTGEVWYYYSSDFDSVAPDDFYYNYRRATYYGTATVTKSSAASITMDETALKKYSYLVFAFLPDGGDPADAEFYFPIVLDVQHSELNTAGIGFTYNLYQTYLSAKPSYDGYLYSYRTNDVRDLPGPDTATFAQLYDEVNPNACDRVAAYKNESIRVPLDNYDYLVVCLVVKGEYLPPLVIDLEKGEEYVPDEGPLNKDYDDESTEKGTGIEYSADSFVNAIRNKVFSFKSNIDGTVTMKFGYYTTNNEFLIVPSTISKTIKNGSDYTFDFGEALANMQKFTGKTLTVIFQANSGAKVYEAVLIQMIED